jgi:hypothetical protein
MRSLCPIISRVNLFRSDICESQRKIATSFSFRFGEIGNNKGKAAGEFFDIDPELEIVLTGASESSHSNLTILFSLRAIKRLLIQIFSRRK